MTEKSIEEKLKELVENFHKEGGFIAFVDFLKSLNDEELKFSYGIFQREYEAKYFFNPQQKEINEGKRI